MNCWYPDRPRQHAVVGCAYSWWSLSLVIYTSNLLGSISSTVKYLLTTVWPTERLAASMTNLPSRVIWIHMRNAHIHRVWHLIPKIVPLLRSSHSLDGTIRQQCTKAENLGVNIRDYLQWPWHIQYLCIRKSVNMLQYHWWGPNSTSAQQAVIRIQRKTFANWSFYEKERTSLLCTTLAVTPVWNCMSKALSEHRRKTFVVTLFIHSFSNLWQADSQ